MKRSTGPGVAMQFGRFHAFLLLAFAALLLVVQTVLILEGRSAAATKAAATREMHEPASRPATAQLPALLYLPGALGVVVAGVGAFVLAQDQRRVLKEDQARRKGVAPSASR